MFSKINQAKGYFLLNKLLTGFGQPTEADGWGTQAVCARALIRCGDEKQASDEISSLQSKVSITYKANPRGSLDYGEGAGDATFQNYIDYL